jgi:ubiquitin-conjugating enzyme E2 Q
MPRKAFVADLQRAVEGVSIVGISDVETGNDDGEFTFMCVADGQKLKISVLIPGTFAISTNVRHLTDLLLRAF